jgi:5-methylcytosine-specific restriction protein A
MLFEVGRVYDRQRDLHARYGGQRQGGISTPTGHPLIFIFTGESGAHYGYEDGWGDGGVFSYTGEGQRGDMQFVRGNKAIRGHIEDGKDLHLFEAQGKGKGYRYIGQFACTSWEERMAPDADQTLRTAIAFHLVAADDDEALAPQSMSKENIPPTDTDLGYLREAAMQASSVSSPANRSEARASYYQRSKAVRDYVLARAAGSCECCKEPAPFLRLDGTPYLEPHHTRRLSDGGPDHPRWVGGICPNCHREIHHGANGDALNQELIGYLEALEA